MRLAGAQIRRSALDKNKKVCYNKGGDIYIYIYKKLSFRSDPDSVRLGIDFS